MLQICNSILWSQGCRISFYLTKPNLSNQALLVPLIINFLCPFWVQE